MSGCRGVASVDRESFNVRAPGDAAPQPTRAPCARIVPPTLPEWVARRPAPMPGRGGHRSGWPYAARDTRPRCRGGVRGRPRCRVRRLGRGHCEGGRRAVLGRRRPGRGDRRGPGWPATGLNSIGPGLWRVLRRGYHRSCPECDESWPAVRGRFRQRAPVAPDHRSSRTSATRDGANPSQATQGAMADRAGSPDRLARTIMAPSAAVVVRAAATPPRTSFPAPSSATGPRRQDFVDLEADPGPGGSAAGGAGPGRPWVQLLDRAGSLGERQAAIGLSSLPGHGSGRGLLGRWPGPKSPRPDGRLSWCPTNAP